VVLEEEVENKTDVSFWLSAAISKTLSFVASAIGRSYLIEQLMKQDYSLLRDIAANY
jgi:hypothetical protein